MQREEKLGKLLVFCHRTSILDQWHQAADRLGLNLCEWEATSDQNDTPIEADGWLVSYQGASRNLQALEKDLEQWRGSHLLAIADEAHHLGMDPDEPEGLAWGRTFLELTKSCRLRIGLTGTPFRADNLGFCAARKAIVKKDGVLMEQISPDLCVEPRDLIAAGDVRPLAFHFQDGWVEHSAEGQPDRDVSPLSAEQRESWRARNLRRAVGISGPGSIGGHVLKKARSQLKKLRRLNPNAAGLVIAKDIEHAEEISLYLERKGEIVDLVHSQDSKAGQRLSDFQTGKAGWLVSIDMCSEGFDAPRLRVVVYLTTVVTRSRFIQGITRAVRISNEQAEEEEVPRQASHVFAPADPRLMEYAKSWSWAEPYVIRSNVDSNSNDLSLGSYRGTSLPLEAVNDGAGEIIKLRTPELPRFLQR